MTTAAPSARLPGLAVLVAAALLSVGASARTTWHVDRFGPGGDGLSWATAYKSLVTALGQAQAGDEVRIAAGSYLPDGGSGSRQASFGVGRGVTLTGGFAGSTAPDPELNDPAVFVTVLSGDLSGDDGPDFTNRSDNVFHVVTLQGGGADASWTLQGLTVRGGQADLVGANESGGAVYAPTEGDEVVFRALTLTDNMALETGGGAFVHSDTDVLVEDSSVVGNRVGLAGGPGPTSGAGGGGLHVGAVTLRGVVVSDNEILSTPNARGGGVRALVVDELSGCRFEANRVNGLNGSGGGLSASVVVLMRDSVFVGNVVNGFTGSAVGGGADITGVSAGLLVSRCAFYGNVVDGGGVAQGGGLCLLSGSPAFVECLFSGNLASGPASSGGGLAIQSTDSVFDHCTLSRNRALAGPGGLLLSNGGEVTRFVSSIVWGNSGTGDLLAQQVAGEPAQFVNSDVQGLSSTSGGSFSADPLLVDSDGADDVAGTEDDDLRLQPGSPCIDAGNVPELALDATDLDCDDDLLETLPLDLDGRARRHDAPLAADVGTGTAPLPDMGAYEFGAPLANERWTDLGGALATAFGTPGLVGGGTLCPGAPLELSLADARPLASATLVLGLAVLNAPFKGGTLVPSPDVLIAGLPTGPGGGFTLAFAWPEDDLAGLALGWQVWISDDTGPLGFGASNGLLSITP